MRTLRNLNLLTLCALFLLFACLSTTVHAGPLSGHALAFDDGSGNGGHGAAWTGTTAYDDGFGLLTGTVDWAVFTEADYLTAFPASGYVPPSGHLVYTYQINNTGTFVAATGLSVGVTPGNPVGTIGTFSGGGVAGDATSGIGFTGLPVDSANYTFTGISAPDSSLGLAFSSPNVPENGLGAVADSGLSATVIPLPTPSGIPIPEPTTALMAGLGFVALMFRRRLR